MRIADVCFFPKSRYAACIEGSSKFQASLAYLNAPWNTERITEIVYDETTGRVERDDQGNRKVRVLVEVEPTWDLHDDRLLPKEERALTEGHGISVMIAHVERGLQDRLTWLIRRYLGRPDGRWRAFSYEELIARDKVNLDVFWLRDESLEETVNLPEPDVLATEIVELMSINYGRSGTVL